jgi:hypothetical protein
VAGIGAYAPVLVHGAGQRSAGGARVLPRHVVDPRSRVMDALGVVLPIGAFLICSGSIVVLFEVVS